MRRKKTLQPTQQKKQGKEPSEAKVQVGKQEEHVEVSPPASQSPEEIFEMKNLTLTQKESESENTKEPLDEKVKDSPQESTEDKPKESPQESLDDEVKTSPQESVEEKVTEYIKKSVEEIITKTLQQSTENQSKKHISEDPSPLSKSLEEEHLKELVQQSIDEQLNEQQVEPTPENLQKDSEASPENLQKDSESSPENLQKDSQASPENLQKDSQASPENLQKDSEAPPENQVQSPPSLADKQNPKSDAKSQTNEVSSDSTKLPSEQDFPQSPEKRVESEQNREDTLQELKEALFREEDLKSKIEGLLNRIKENSEILHQAHVNQEVLKASLEESQAEVRKVKEENRQLLIQLSSSTDQNEKLQAQLAELSSMNFGFDKEMEERNAKEEENFRGSFKPTSSARNSWEATTLPLPKYGDFDLQNHSEQQETQASTHRDDKSVVQTHTSEVKASLKAPDSDINFSSQLKQQLDELKELNKKQQDELKRSAGEKAIYVTKVAENENTAQMVAQLVIKTLDCKASSKDKKQSMIQLARLLNLSEADRKLIGVDAKSKKMTFCSS